MKGSSNDPKPNPKARARGSSRDPNTRGKDDKDQRSSSKHATERVGLQGHQLEVRAFLDEYRDWDLVYERFQFIETLYEPRHNIATVETSDDDRPTIEPEKIIVEHSKIKSIGAMNIRYAAELEDMAGEFYLAWSRCRVGDFLPDLKKVIEQLKAILGAYKPQYHDKLKWSESELRNDVEKHLNGFKPEAIAIIENIRRLKARRASDREDPEGPDYTFHLQVAEGVKKYHKK